MSLTNSGLPLVTIGISSFNSIISINRALNSAIEQDWSNTEILIVDDASDDGSYELLAKRAKQLPNVRLIKHSKNLGVGATRNTILQYAKGDFIAFFDDDDYSVPHRLSNQLSRIVDYENATGASLIASYSARNQILPTGDSNYEPTIGMSVTPAPVGNSVIDYLLLGKPPRGGRGSCATCSLMARKEVFSRVGGFNPKLRRNEDTDFNFRLALQNGHFAGVSNPLVTQTLSYSTDKSFSEYKASKLAWLNFHQEYLEKLSVYGFCVRWENVKFDFFERKFLPFLLGITSLFLRYPVKSTRRFLWALPNRRTLWNVISQAEETTLESK